MPDFKLIVLEPRVKPGAAASLVFGLVGTPDQEGLYARVEVAGYTLNLSNLGDGWRIDDAFRGELPAFVNGFGSVLSDPAALDLQRFLNDEAGKLAELHRT